MDTVLANALVATEWFFMAALCQGEGLGPKKPDGGRRLSG